MTTAYHNLKDRFERFPHHAVPDGDNVSKNFGLSKWNDPDVEGEEDLMAMNANDDIYEDFKDTPVFENIKQEMKDSVL